MTDLVRCVDVGSFVKKSEHDVRVSVLHGHCQSAVAVL